MYKKLELYSNNSEFVEFILSEKHRNYEYVKSHFTHKYTCRVNLNTDLYKFSFDYDFFEYNFTDFLKKIKDVYATLNGKAHLNNGFYDNDFNISIESKGNTGLLIFRIEIIRYIHDHYFAGEDKLCFERVIDQSYLPALISEIENFLI